MRTLTTTVFTYDELSDEAKKKAVSNSYDINVEDILCWYDDIYDTFKSKLIAMGYSEIEPRFSGFHSQGDGASFQAVIDLSVVGPRLTNRKESFFNMLENKDVCINIVDTHWGGQYVHENTKRVDLKNYDIDDDINEDEHKLLVGLEEKLEAERKNLSKELYSTLKSEYEYLTSDIQIIDKLKSAEDIFEFTEDGSKY